MHCSATVQLAGVGDIYGLGLCTGWIRTSGLLGRKSELAYQRLTQQLKERRVQRRYSALVLEG